MKTKSGEVEQHIKDLEKKILEIGGSKLLTQKSKVDGLRLHIKLANDELTKAEVTKAKAEKDAAKYQATVARDSEALESVEEEVKDLEGQIEELETYISDLREKVESAQLAAENSRDDLEEIKTKLTGQEEVIAAFRQEEVRPTS